MEVLLDLDGTLINGEYCLTDEAIYDAIKSAISKGYRVGINSDSALQTCQKWHKLLGMNGAIILEHGAAVSLDGSDTTLSAWDEDPGKFDDLRKSLIDALDQYQDNTFITLVEGVQVVRGKNVNLSIDPGFQKVILVSPLRQWSMCFFTRIHENGEYDFAPEFLLSCVDTLKRLVAADDRFQEMWWDVNPDYGLCILHDEKTKKRCGIARLLETNGDDQLIMIGNSMSDFIGDPRVRQFAVSNASQEYRDASEKVATLPLTSGVVELLNGLEPLK